MQMGSAYVKSPDWLRCQNARVNPKNVNDRCFQYTFTLTRHYKEIKNRLGQLSSFKVFLDLYNWEGY